MQGLQIALEWVSFAAFIGLALLTFVLWNKRKDAPSLWTFLTFLVLAIVVVVGRFLEDVDPGRSALMDYLVTLLIAILLLFPYFLYRIAHSFSPGARVSHWAAATTTAIVVVWAVFIPRFPDENEPQPQWFRIFVFAIVFQWVLCSVLVAVRLWRAGTGQPPVTRKRMRMLSLASTGMSVAIIISAFAPSGDERAIGVEVAIQLFSIMSAVAFYFAFAPPAWLRASWRRDSEEDSRRAIIDLMGAVTDEAVVDVLLPHAAALIGAEGVGIIDTDGHLIGAHNLDPRSWENLALDDEEVMKEAAMTKFDFPFGSLIVKTTPYTLFFGSDEIELLQALGVMTNLALERVRASEMRLQISEAQLKRHQALEINDNVVQGLAVAKYAFELGDDAKGREAIEGTLAAARRIISDLLDEVSADKMFGVAALTRDEAATGFVHKES